MSETVQTRVGTSVVTTPSRVYNPVNDTYEKMDSLSQDGYKRLFLAIHHETNDTGLININEAEMLSFDKDKWDLLDDDTSHVVVLKDADGETQTEGTQHD